MQERLQVQVRQMQVVVQYALLAHMQLQTRLRVHLALQEHIKALLVNPLALDHTLVVLERKLSQVQHPLKVDVLTVSQEHIKLLQITSQQRALLAVLVNTLLLDLRHAQHVIKEHTLQVMLHHVLLVQMALYLRLEVQVPMLAFLADKENVGQEQLV